MFDKTKTLYLAGGRDAGRTYRMKNIAKYIALMTVAEGDNVEPQFDLLMSAFTTPPKAKKILYIDMDGVVADFEKGLSMLCPELDWNAPGNHEEVERLCTYHTGLFEDLDPIPHAIESVKLLFDYWDVYFLSTPMYCVPESYTAKRLWLETHFGEMAAKRLILTHRKDLAIGHVLIDDRTAHGAGDFAGRHIHFGQPGFDTWGKVLTELVTELLK